MGLSNAYVQCYAQIKDLFAKIAEGQAPSQFTIRHLKDIGFTKSNHRAFIPLLKALGFLTPDGSPTARYHDYRDLSKARRIIAEAIRDAYGDVFVIKEKPTKSDRAAIEGKFKSAHNTTDRMATLMASTFYALLDLADLESSAPPMRPGTAEAKEPEAKPPATEPPKHPQHNTALHYNIQIHLPATKDVEVFNAIFKSLKEHLLD